MILRLPLGSLITHSSPLLLVATILVLVTYSSPLTAAPDDSTANATASNGGRNNLQYKMLSGFKQPFNDDLQLHLSKGWEPVGGVSVTTWNNDLYFAQLLSRRAAQ